MAPSFHILILPAHPPPHACGVVARHWATPAEDRPEVIAARSRVAALHHYAELARLHTEAKQAELAAELAYKQAARKVRTVVDVVSWGHTQC